ncbi:hypothetical protein EJ03DRAFT_329744 [Teratosphaeria nubilosa]|uniref:Uncharacterized protein n=1 Tax=Teratosphaeria nubilosa TaxID=161662 RepID=A0A6G1L2N3_9PEZI|nr:hypothetical protein EJ03DRAFT_329744 [Teratosphaeria nubilosa]
MAAHLVFVVPILPILPLVTALAVFVSLTNVFLHILTDCLQLLHLCSPLTRGDDAFVIFPSE